MKTNPYLRSFIESWAKFCVNQRVLVLLFSLVFMAVITFPISKIGFVWNFEMWFEKGNQQLKIFDEFKETFGESQYLIVGVESAQGKTVVEPRTLEAVHQLTTFLEEHRHIEKVDSLTNYETMTAANDILVMRDLIEDPDAISQLSQADLDNISRILRGETLVHGVLVNPSLNDTIISAKVIYKESESEHHVELVNETKAFLREKGYDGTDSAVDFKIHLTGLPILYERYMVLSQQDLGTALPLTFLICIVALIIIFRTLAGLFYPLLLIILSTFSIFGFMGWVGWFITSVNTYLPLMMLIVGVCDSLHILVEFYHQRRNGYSSKDAARLACKNMFIPCLFTSVTTALGFMSLQFSEMPPVQEFGGTAAFGVIVAFVFSVTLLPALLTFTRKVPALNSERRFGNVGGGIMSRCVKLASTRGTAIIGVSAVLLIASLGLITQIQVDSNYVKVFSERTTLRQDIEYFNEHYAGTLNMELIIDAGKDGGIKDPAFLERLSALQDFLDSLNDVGRTTSIAPYIMKMNKVMHNNEEAQHTIPETREHVAQYLLLYASAGPREDLSSMKSFNERYVRLQFYIPILSTSQTSALLDTIERELDTNFRNLNVILTGENFLIHYLNNYIESGMPKTFAISLLTITLSIMILLRSVRYSLLAAGASVFPILLVGGIVGAFGIFVDMTNMIVAAMTFGIAVDDVIHIAMKFLHFREEGMSKQRAIETSIRESGPAILFSSVILFLGFSVMMTSSFIPYIYFGLLTGLIILFAFLSATLLFPSLILVLPGLATTSQERTAAGFAAAGQDKLKPETVKAGGEEI